MATKEQQANDSNAFKSTFGEDDAVKVAQTDDDAFGLTPPVDDDADFPATPEEALLAEEPAADAGQGAESAAPVEEASETPAQEPQKQEPQKQEALEQDADKAAGIDPDKALKMLAEDFGEDFANMLVSIIEAKVAQANSVVTQSVDEIISDIVDSKARAHFETIADQHPDFMDVADSAAFKDYVTNLPGEESAAAQQAIETGTAREICKLLAAFKASQTPAKDHSDERMNAAEGVRSTGLRLPVAPSESSDYAKAWDEA